MANLQKHFGQVFQTLFETLLRYFEKFFFTKTKLCTQYLFLNTERSSAKLSPNPYPTITQGDKLRLTCSVNKATVNITWKKDGDPIKERAVIDTQLDERTSYLVIAKVVEEDSGEYSCEALNRLGNVDRSIVMIKVNRKLVLLLCRNNLKFNSNKSFD